MAAHTSNTGRLALNNSVYDVAKEATTLWLPGLATLYVALAGFWDLPKPTEVSGSILAVVTFLGLVLKVSTSSYNNGKLENPDNKKTVVVEPAVVTLKKNTESTTVTSGDDFDPSRV